MDRSETHGAVGSAREPMRRCAGCGGRAPARTMLRLVVTGDPPFVVADRKKRLPGRGASVHPKPACVAAVAKPQRLRRAFPSAPNSVWAGSDVRRELEDQLLQAVLQWGDVGGGGPLDQLTPQTVPQAVMATAEGQGVHERGIDVRRTHE